MIRIEFNHMALIDTDSDGATILFPSTGHRVQIGVKGGAMRPLNGLAWIEGRDHNGRPVPEDSTDFDKDDRVPSLTRALGDLVGHRRIIEPATLLQAGVIQASLRLTGGKLFARRGIPVCPEDDHFMDRRWETGPVRSRLTNRVDYELENESGTRYWLVTDNGDRRDPIPVGTTLEVKNQDMPPDPPCQEQVRPTLSPGQQADVEIRDFAELYRLLTGKEAGPLPRTRVQADGDQSIKIPIRPLCPVGEP